MDTADYVVLGATLLVGVVAGWFSTRLGMLLARRTGALAMPGPRGSHTQPTPRLGGFGYFIPLMVILALAALLPGLLSRAAWAVQPSLRTFFVVALAGGALAFAIGFLDDYLGLPAFFKLLGQIAVALLFLEIGSEMIHTVAAAQPGEAVRTFAGAGFERVALTRCLALDGYWPDTLSRADEWTLHVPPLAVVMSFLFLIIFMNAFNFMDGIDGLAATFTIVVAIGVFAAFVPEARQLGGLRAHVFVVMMLATLLVGISVGFLFYNWPVAHVFLGDCGSQFVGFVLAALLMQLTRLAGEPAADAQGVARALALPRRAYIDFLAVLILVWPFLYDVGFTLVRRWARGERLWRAHHEHLYQRLIDQAWSRQEVLLLSVPFYLAHAALFYAYAWAPTNVIRWMWAGVALLPMLIYTLIVWAAEGRSTARAAGVAVRPAGGVPGGVVPVAIPEPMAEPAEAESPEAPPSEGAAEATSPAAATVAVLPEEVDTTAPIVAKPKAPETPAEPEPEMPQAEGLEDQDVTERTTLALAEEAPTRLVAPPVEAEAPAEEAAASEPPASPGAPKPTTLFPWERRPRQFRPIGTNETNRGVFPWE